MALNFELLHKLYFDMGMKVCLLFSMSQQWLNSLKIFCL